MMRTRKELIQAAINEGLDRKNDLLLELGSFRSGSRASKSSVSSNAVQAHAKGEAATALKKAEMQRKISEFQTKSALALEQEERKRREDELIFDRRKREEEARLRSLRAEQEAAVAVACTKANDEELGLNLDFQTIDLPIEDSNKRVQEFIDSQFEGLKPYEDHHDRNLEAKNLSARSFLGKEEKPCFAKELNPGAPPFNPNPTDRTEGFVQFLSRRELIANKIEKFDSSPENFNTWKAAFKNMLREVNISSSEELALMAEHATGDSKRLIQRLRNAYIENPAKGV